MKGNVFKLGSRCFLCMMITVLLLGACEKGKNGAVIQDDNEIHIRVWESNNGPNEFIRQAGKKFTELHPNIIIDYLYMEYDNISKEIKVDGPLGIGPDLFAAPHDCLGKFVADNDVMPTENPEFVKENTLGACSKAVTYNGSMYGYPISAETYALYYNKNLIKESEVPKTWEELCVWVEKFNKENPDKKGFVMDFANAYYSIIFATSGTNRPFGESGTDAKRPNVNTAEAIKGFEYMQSLRTRLGLEDIKPDTSTSDGLFSSGHAAMHISGPWNLVAFEEAGIDFGIAPLPSLPGEKSPCASFSGTRCMFVSSYSLHPHEAAMFAEFLISPEMQKLRFEITGSMPCIETDVNSAYITGFLKQLDYAFPMPSIPEMGTFWTEMAPALEKMWYGADVKKEMDACAAKF